MEAADLGAYGWKRCIHGTTNGIVRAVKKIGLGRQGLNDVTYIRKLKAAAKFSQPQVQLLLSS
jgi:hypothetical protein